MLLALSRIAFLKKGFNNCFTKKTLVSQKRERGKNPNQSTSLGYAGHLLHQGVERFQADEFKMTFI